MFMEREELKNAIALAKLQVRANIWGWMIALFGLITMISISIVSDIGHLANDTADDFVVESTSFLSLYLGIAALVTLIQLSTYRSTNEKLQIYPQTNTSRYVASQLVTYLYSIIIGIIILLGHLIKLATFLFLASSNNHIHFAFRYDWDYFLFGFLVNLLYAFLLISFFTLIKTIVSKFKVYAGIGLAVFFAMLITNVPALVIIIDKVTSLLTEESSLLLFFLKGLALWIIFIVLSYLLNKKTIYYLPISFSKKEVISILVSIPIIVGIVFLFSFSNYDLPRDESIDVITENHYSTTIDFDTSNVQGVTPKIVFEQNEDGIETEFDTLSIEYLGVKVSEKVAREKVIVECNFPTHIVNGADISKYYGFKLIAKTEGNTLKLRCDYDKKSRVIFLNGWMTMRQFEKYSGFRYSSNESSESAGSGTIEVLIPKEGRLVETTN